jgi:SAM-dependent methyltransferase
MAVSAAKITSKIPRSARWALLDGALWIKALAYRGNTFGCNVCGGRFSHFKPLGDPARLNAMCPRCRSLERHRLLWWFLSGQTKIRSSSLRVLHVAPEGGIERQLRNCPELDYVTADLSGRADIKMDITRIEYPDASFDVVLCSHVLEHVSDCHVAMREFHRVLIPGGFAIVDVPIDPSLTHMYEDWSITTAEGRREAFGQWDHVRRFGTDYPDLLQAAGFTVTVDPVRPNITEQARFGIREDEHIYLCDKAQ